MDVPEVVQVAENPDELLVADLVVSQKKIFQSSAILETGLGHVLVTKVHVVVQKRNGFQFPVGESSRFYCIQVLVHVLQIKLRKAGEKPVTEHLEVELFKIISAQI